jgi:hypothetical protein
MSKTHWYISRGDIVKVKYYKYHGTHQGLEQFHGIVVSEKFEDENTMFPCVLVYIFGLNESQRCMAHQLEILSSVI